MTRQEHKVYVEEIKNNIGCATCKKAISKEDRYFPFCSSRCRMADLDKWLKGDFKLAGERTNVSEPEQME